ncbi:type 1 glutamine amidotransferase domain-containing protein [Rhodoferax sp.]|uniref:type 1 glutamine amidotransferase domain-containing protein n=1 Tax=Rhodoferax sp. TaxID=50421 RepID=UPI002759FA8C|nr:type 1 glutamine amidotransferase domain-containing protein [Rhodoferax sp.]
MAKILIPLPSTDFDPTESAVPWLALTQAGHAVSFATPDGEPGEADPIMVGGKGLGPLAPLLMADNNGRKAYAAMASSAEFQRPLRHADVQSAITRDSPGELAPGFVVRDGNYLSARWPGDAHRFANEFLKMLDDARDGRPELHTST